MGFDDDKEFKIPLVEILNVFLSLLENVTGRLASLQNGSESEEAT